MKRYNYERCMKFNCDECMNRRTCDGKENTRGRDKQYNMNSCKKVCQIILKERS